MYYDGNVCSSPPRVRGTVRKKALRKSFLRGPSHGHGTVSSIDVLALIFQEVSSQERDSESDVDDWDVDDRKPPFRRGTVSAVPERARDPDISLYFLLTIEDALGQEESRGAGGGSPMLWDRSQEKAAEHASAETPISCPARFPGPAAEGELRACLFPVV